MEEEKAFGTGTKKECVYSYTLPVGAGARGVPHLRHRLAAPGRLTAMCHDRRTNAGNLQFSFALIDHTVAGKAFTLAKQDCISNQGIVFLSPTCYSLFSIGQLFSFYFNPKCISSVQQYSSYIIDIIFLNSVFIEYDVLSFNMSKIEKSYRIVKLLQRFVVSFNRFPNSIKFINSYLTIDLKILLTEN